MNTPYLHNVQATQNYWDHLFHAALVGAMLFVLQRYGAQMDGYEVGILLATIPALWWLNRAWGQVKILLGCTAVLALSAIQLYAGDVVQGQTGLLKYVLSSQSAILWMCVLYGMAFIAYWAGLLGRAATLSWMGSMLTQAGSVAGMTGLLVRWYESYLLGADVGHIPLSNLYEVFVLFALITALFYLYYEARYATRQLGGFVMFVVCAAVAFLLWYTFERQAHEIQPLLPALQSWWMKIHVPANFIGYGTFSLAAMVAFAWLIKSYAEQEQRAAQAGEPAPRRWRLAPLFILGVLLCLEPLVFRSKTITTHTVMYWALYFGISSVAIGGVLAVRQRIAPLLPDLAVLDDLMYRAIAVGFAFFTIATILGALWAADAWGTYWQWDPKETWALIVWLNYAAWLHLRLIKGLRGALAAYWALVGLLVTGFAFLGVNMFLSGLHSYGTL
jgi:cytochrome c-type biogenesis protein CcsB